jgi:hypothetical protein
MHDRPSRPQVRTNEQRTDVPSFLPYVNLVPASARLKLSESRVDPCWSVSWEHARPLQLFGNE